MSNPDWPLASEVAKEMGDESTANIKRVCAEMKQVREAGYSVVVAVACWREWKQQLNDAGLNTPRLFKVLKDNRLENYIKEWGPDGTRMPPVYESDSHDRAVLENSELLREIGFVYRAARLPVETLDSLGVKHE